MSWDTLRTEVANSVFTKVQKVLTPDFNEGATVLWTVSGLDTIYTGLNMNFEFEFLLADRIGRELKCWRLRNRQLKTL
jgi:hypothetical protein